MDKYEITDKLPTSLDKKACTTGKPSHPHQLPLWKGESEGVEVGRGGSVL